jgi:hypothetical protein
MRKEAHNFLCYPDFWEAVRVLSERTNMSMSKIVETATKEYLLKNAIEVETDSR